MNKPLTINRKESGSKMITVRFKPSEYAKLEAKANRSAVPIATLVRFCALHLLDREIVLN